MPTTVTINDPRSRSQNVFIDLSDPMKYRIIITREIIRDIIETGEVYSRESGRQIIEEITFDSDGTPHGDETVLSLIGPIGDAINTLVLKHGVS